MKTFRLPSGEDASVVLERGNKDGGLIVCYEITEADGTRSAYRAWYSDPVQARAAYDAADSTVTENRVTTIRTSLDPVQEIDGVRTR